MQRRLAFLEQQAPENYVAGLGRGATGFTTRSDLGPAREGPSEEQIKEALAKRAAQLGQPAPTAYGGAEKKGQDEEEENERENYNQDPDNEVGLFSGGVYDRDDDEADRIYQDVDEKMDKRRKIRREAREQAERDDYERKNPKIQQQFADLKRALGTVTDEEWASIPAVGDLTGRNKRLKQTRENRYYAVPDSVIAGAREAGQFETSISTDGAQTNGDSADGTMTNFADIGAARNKVLQVRLDQANSGTETDVKSGTATNIDPKGYLTSLTQSELRDGEVKVGDINRVRTLLESVIKTNPKHAPGWIAAARLEELAGRVVAARNTIAKGCEHCPKSEDAWLENIRINEGQNARIIAANAIKNNDRSVRLWIEAMNLETDARSKRRVLRQALDHIPQSVAIWKEAVNLEENPADARLLLHKATELIPLSVELWLALARLETPENAQVVLNKARKSVPASHEIWIAAGRLQEQMGEPVKVDMVMKRAIQSLARESAMLKREEWITEAEKCEEEGALITCSAIIRETLGWTLNEDDDRRDIWMDDAKSSTVRGRFATARAIYAYTLRVFPNSKSVWLAAAELEREHGTKEELRNLLEKAVQACSKSEVLWLQLARVSRQMGEEEEEEKKEQDAVANGMDHGLTNGEKEDKKPVASRGVNAARSVLARAFNENNGNEEIWLAAVKLEFDAKQFGEARNLLREAREKADTDRVWVKSVAFERAQGNTDSALNLVNDALVHHPRPSENSPYVAKLYMMKGQIYEHDFNPPKLPQARESYTAGTKACPKSVSLWLLLARLEERAGMAVKVRSVLDRARLTIPKNPELLLETVRFERRAGNIAAAQNTMARALQDIPANISGLLWAERIWFLEPRTARKPLALEAIKKVDNDPVLFVAVARIFWSERRLEKAATWFEKSVVLDPDMGDTWAWYMKFLRQHGTSEKRQDVLSKCVAREPKHGEIWQMVSKDPRNAGKTVAEILDMVIEKLE